MEQFVEHFKLTQTYINLFTQVAYAMYAENVIRQSRTIGTCRT